MTPSFSPTVVDDRKTKVPTPRRPRARLRGHLRTAIAIAIAVVAIGLLNARGEPGPGDDKDQSRPIATGAGQASDRAFVAEIRRNLQRDDERLISLAEQVLKVADDPDRLPREPIAAFELRARSAEARYQAARLDREVAESDLEEYQKVTSVHEKADVESEIQLAKDELERARKAIPEAKERLARIKPLLKNQSASDLVLEDNYAARIISVTLTEQKAMHLLEQAETKRKLLEEYTKPKTIKDLNSAVEMTRSNELACQTIWELEKLKVVKLNRSIKRAYLPDVQKRILALVQQTFPIQAAIEAKLDQLVKGGQPDDSLQASLRDLTNQLRSLVDRAEGERAAARFAPLKTRVQRSDRPSARQRLFGP